ncbi:MAG TPA: 2Fe-2S iron-sulfur cluster binding domain-containing protein [Chondromyces sp.]|nr:2Fe-2S iron-sulfur cluster binding domain-containing protein [Chondromyces sp.]
MFNVKIMDNGGEIPELKCPETESILDAALKHGMKIPYACKGGGCGLCKIKVQEGDFERKKSSKAVLPDSERSLNFTLACKTFPKGDMKIQVDLSKEEIHTV